MNDQQTQSAFLRDVVDARKMWGERDTWKRDETGECKADRVWNGLIWSAAHEGMLLGNRPGGEWDDHKQNALNAARLEYNMRSRQTLFTPTGRWWASGEKEHHEPTCPDLWVTGNKPDIAKGTCKRYWVTIRNKERGTLCVSPMTYRNSHVMPLSDQCDEPPACAVPHNPEPDGYCEEYEWTGWSRGECEHCECDWMWENHYCEIIAYAPAPEPYRPNTPSEETS